MDGRNSSTLFEVGLERSIDLLKNQIPPPPPPPRSGAIVSSASLPDPRSSQHNKSVGGGLLRAESVEVIEYVASGGSPGLQHHQIRLLNAHLTTPTETTNWGVANFEDDVGQGGVIAPPHVVNLRGYEGELQTESLNKFSHRFLWLVALLMLQSLSSFILKNFEALLIRHPIIVFFLTMLVGAGGNAGSQSTVLVIRAIARGEFDPHKTLRSFIRKEILTGLKLAVILSLVSFVRVYLFDGDIWEVLAICGSMFVIVFVAVLIGLSLPLLLWYCGWDPAHAGAAIQVTIDIIGVSITCLMSTLLLGLLASNITPPPPPIVIKG